MKKKIEIEFLNVNSIKPAPFNPVQRTTDKALVTLIKSMEKDGFWTHSPIVLTKDNFIADGHRRWTTAKKLGINEVPCLRTDKNLQEAWSEINATMRTINSQETFQAYALGLRELPDNHTGKAMKYILNKYGEEMVLYCAEHGLSKSPIQYAEKIARYINRNTAEAIPQIVKWLVENKMINIARIAIESDYPRATLAKLIDTNQPLAFK